MPATFATLPRGIMENILQHLPPKDQARAACSHPLWRQAAEPVQLHYFAGRGEEDRVLRLLLRDNVRRSIDSRHCRWHPYRYGHALHRETALAAAAARGHSQVVRILLAALASPSAADSHCATSLMRAAEGGHVTVVRLLLLAGATINAVDERGDAALMLAVRGVVKYGSVSMAGASAGLQAAQRLAGTGNAVPGTSQPAARDDIPVQQVWGQCCLPN